MNNTSLAFVRVLVLGLIISISSCQPAHQSESSSPEASTPQTIVWVGTSHDSVSAAIRSFSIDPTSGALTKIAEADAIQKVSFFDINEANNVLYGVYMKDGKGTVGAFSVSGVGKLTWLGELSTDVKGPCYVSVADEGNQLLVANYSGGNIQRFSLAADGSVAAEMQRIQHEGSSVNQQRQESAHPHMIKHTPNHQYVFVPDLGTDQVMSYSWKGGELVPSTVPFVKMHAGAGPRHFDIHEDLRIAYVLDELTSEVTAVQLGEDFGLLDTIATYPLLPEDFIDFNKSSDIHVSPNGKFLYAANRGHNSLTIFRVMADGQLEFVGRESTRGDFPRNFAISPDGQFLLVGNRNSDNLLVFRINSETGLLTLLHEYHQLPGILCIKFQQVG